jgi:hypothetical protein
MDTSNRPAWVDAFVMRLSALGVRAEPEAVSSMAEELWPTMGHIDPRTAAEAEWAEWPPHDD